MCFGNWPDLADFADFADLVGLVNFVDFANLANLANFANFGGFAGRLGGRSAGAVSLPSSSRMRVAISAAETSPVPPGFKPLQLEVAHAYAPHLVDGMPGLKKFITQRIAPRLGERHLVPRHFLAPKTRDVRAGSAREAFDFGEREQRLELQLIGLPQIVRLQDAVGQVAVVGQQYQPVE